MTGPNNQWFDPPPDQPQLVGPPVPPPVPGAYSPAVVEVRGQCPMGCGESLTVVDGRITCSNQECPRRDAAGAILDDTDLVLTWQMRMNGDLAAAPSPDKLAAAVQTLRRACPSLAARHALAGLLEELGEYVPDRLSLSDRYAAAIQALTAPEPDDVDDLRAPAAAEAGGPA